MSDTSDEKFNAEKKEAYHELINKIDNLNADKTKNIGDVFVLDEYKDLIGKYYGIEAISLYEVSGTENTDNRRQINFLYERKDDQGDLPMYWANSKDNSKSMDVDTYKVGIADINSRRELQKEALQNPEKRTSAELCAQYISANRDIDYILVHFGEILAYSFLYHLIVLFESEKNTKITKEKAINAWKELRNAHQKRKPSSDEKTLIKGILDWYKRDLTEQAYNRDFLKENKIDAIYEYNSDLVNYFEEFLNSTRIDVDKKRNYAINFFAEKLYTSFERSLKKSNEQEPRKLFWKCSLVNPLIEQGFCSHGLYVTVIRSPLNPIPSGRRETDSSDSNLSSAYAICTLTDIKRFENIECRNNLNIVLRRLANEELARSDYTKTKKTQSNLEEQINIQVALMKFYTAVANRDIDYKSLIEQTAQLVFELELNKPSGNGVLEGVLVSWKSVGVYKLFKGENGNIAHWVSPISFRASCISDIVGNIPENGWEFSSECYKDKPSLFSKLERNIGQGIVSEAIPIGIRDGSIILFRCSGNSTEQSNNVLTTLKSVGEALQNGLETPFRSAVPAGLVKYLLIIFVDLFFFIFYFFWIDLCLRIVHKIRRLFTKCGRKDCPLLIKSVTPARSNSISLFPIKDFIIATLMEFVQIGFILVGVAFLVSALSLSYETFMTYFPHQNELNVKHTNHILTNIEHNEPNVKDTINILNNIEHTVMAFSIFLATIGIIFLLSPSMAVGQPEWMRRFAKLDTLEQTIVRLVAMVLTIDVFSAVLVARGEMLKGGNPLDFFQPTLIYIGVYICVLVGLAFLSKYLLGEELGKEHEKETNDKS